MTIRYAALSLLPVLVVAGRFHNEQPPWHTEKPRIEITNAPPKGGGPDSNGTIGGRVSGVKGKVFRVVVFARTDKWYVQPFSDSPYTSIGDTGEWETATHLGNEYAALLVKESYKPPATTHLLPNLSDTVLAITTAPGKTEPNPRSPAEAPRATQTVVRKIQFSGYEWSVKTSAGRAGPGPNYFSDSRDNVDVDEQGRLRLRITQRDGKWNCAEVISTGSFGYGTYRFYIDGSVDSLDPQIVLGLFTWSDEPSFAHREIDVEVSRWSVVTNKNAQFVIQPYTRSDNIVRFQIPSGLSATTHSFTWKPDSVFCESVSGLSASPPTPDAYIQRHTFTKDIPKAGGENARINLWLLGGRRPGDGKDSEIIVSRFEFSPAA
jgi:hypothetical protein